MHIATETAEGNASDRQYRRRAAAMGMAETLDEAFEQVGAPIRFARNTEIYGQAEPAEHFYKVVAGAVRTHKLLSDGRRQIGAFYLPGDIFGLEAGEIHRFSAEAVSDSVVRIAGRAAISALAARNIDLATELWAATAEKLERAEEHMILLGRKTAEERVATFLIDMAHRARSEGTVELPMSRQDIADYLGLTIETVSRTLTHLESKEAIELPSSRRITLRNRVALQRLYA
jgi:CRP/FNR family nitrogen fixation transcriptional regulator